MRITDFDSDHLFFNDIHFPKQKVNVTLFLNFLSTNNFVLAINISIITIYFIYERKFENRYVNITLIFCLTMKSNIIDVRFIYESHRI